MKLIWLGWPSFRSLPLCALRSKVVHVLQVVVQTETLPATIIIRLYPSAWELCVVTETWDKEMFEVPALTSPVMPCH